MKKIILSLLLVVSALGASNANAWCCYRGGYYHGGYNSWVAPAIIGGVVGYSIARPYYAQPVYVQPVYVQPQPQAVYVQQPNPSNYHQENILDANCNCYRTVLVPN